jgi:hypothetical protein
MKRSAPENGRLPGHPPVAAADGAAGPVANRLSARRVSAVLLLGAAAMDLTRCGLVAGTVRQAWEAATPMSAGLAAAAVSIWTARMPARRALVRLGRLSHRCGVSPASFRLRFQGRLRDPRRGDCRPRGAVGEGCPGYRRPRRANTVLEKPVALSGSASHLINRARAATGPRRGTVMHTHQPDPQG